MAVADASDRGMSALGGWNTRYRLLVGRRALRAGEALRLDREPAGEELLLEGGELGGA